MNLAVALTPGQIPQAPTNLRAVAVRATGARLAWNDNSLNEAGFHLERMRVDVGAWRRIATLGPNATAYRDTGLRSGVTYRYRVRAYNADGVSAWSNVKRIRTP